MRLLLRACLTVQAAGLLGGAPYIALYTYHGSAIGYAPAAILDLAIFGAILTFIPTFFYVTVLAAIIRCAGRRQWPAWTPYLAALGLMTLFFFALISFSPHPLPDVAMHFIPVAPAVPGPALSASEIPLLAIALIAGLLGAWVCSRVVRVDITRQ